jgi:hypothetical protein
LNRKLIALNVALVVLLAASGWRLWDMIERAREREEAVVGQALEPVEAVAEPAVSLPPPAYIAEYSPIAQQVLFFRDRNPNIEIEVAPPPPLPPLPVAHGVLDIGSGPTVILSEDGNGPQRGYQAGDTIGGFTIAQVANDRLLLDWEGGRISRTIEELSPKETAAVQRQPVKPKPKPAAAAKQVIGAAEKAGPSDIDMGGGIRACKPGDASEPGTVADGYKKVVTQTPFGRVCRWEPVQ